MFKKLLKALFKRAIPKPTTPRRYQPTTSKPKPKNITLEEFKAISEQKRIKAQSERLRLNKERLEKAKINRKHNKAVKEFKELRKQVERIAELESGVMKYERANKKSYTGLDQYARMDITKLAKDQIPRINKKIKETLNKFNIVDKTNDYIETFFHILSRLEENPYDPDTESYAYDKWNKKYVQTELGDFLRNRKISRSELEEIIAMRNEYVKENEQYDEMISEQFTQKVLEILEYMEII